jgi:hypothetical protein
MKDPVPARGSLRSRGAALQIAAGVMDAFGPSLAGTSVEQIDAANGFNAATGKAG